MKSEISILDKWYLYSSVQENTGFRGMKFWCPIRKAFFEKKGLGRGGGGDDEEPQEFGLPLLKNFPLESIEMLRRVSEWLCSYYSWIDLSTHRGSRVVFSIPKQNLNKFVEPSNIAKTRLNKLGLASMLYLVSMSHIYFLWWSPSRTWPLHSNTL